MPALLVLFAAAGALTSVWLGGFVVYVNAAVGWSNLLDLPPSDFALFCFAAFGPVAAVWLVVGFLQQGLAGERMDRVLRALMTQIRRNSEQMETQARTLIQMQAESRRRSVIDGMDLVLKDLNGQAAVLAERLGMISEDEANTLWARTVSGDVWAFAYAFLTRADAYPDFPELLAERLAEDSVSTAALQLFLRRYDSLLDSFKVNDADKLAREVLEDGPLARLHGLFAVVDRHALVRLGHAPHPGVRGPQQTAGLAVGLADEPAAPPIPRWSAPEAEEAEDRDAGAFADDERPLMPPPSPVSAPPVSVPPVSVPPVSAPASRRPGAAMLFGEASPPPPSPLPPSAPPPPADEEELDYEPLYRPPPPLPSVPPSVPPSAPPAAGSGSSGDDDRVARWLATPPAAEGEDGAEGDDDDAPTFIDLLEEDEAEDRPLSAAHAGPPGEAEPADDWRRSHPHPEPTSAGAADGAGIEESLARLHDALRRMNGPATPSVVPEAEGADAEAGGWDDAEAEPTLSLTAAPQRPAPPPASLDPEATYRDIDPALVALIRGDGLDDPDDDTVYPDIEPFAFPAPPPPGPARAARAAAGQDAARARRDLLFGGPASHGGGRADAPPAAPPPGRPPPRGDNT